MPLSPPRSEARSAPAQDGGGSRERQDKKSLNALARKSRSSKYLDPSAHDPAAGQASSAYGMAIRVTLSAELMLKKSIGA